MTDNHTAQNRSDIGMMCCRRHHHGYYSPGNSFHCPQLKERKEEECVEQPAIPVLKRTSRKLLCYRAAKSGLVFETTAFEVLVFVISFITKCFPSGIFAVLLRLVNAHAGHNTQIKCPHHFTNYSLLKKKLKDIFPCYLLVQMSMLMTSEYLIVHSDEYITSYCWFVLGESQEKKSKIL